MLIYGISAIFETRKRQSLVITAAINEIPLKTNSAKGIQKTMEITPDKINSKVNGRVNIRLVKIPAAETVPKQ